jgi:RNA polymerase sigma-70 factor (ECF subfamily)
MIADVRAGIPDGWTKMVRLYAPWVLWHCRHGFPPWKRIPRLSGVPGQDAEEVVQEVFLTVFKGIKTFTKKDEKPAAFRRWLYAITRFKVCEYWAARSRFHHEIVWSEIDDVPATDPPSEDEDGVPVRVLLLRGLVELIRLDFEDRTFQAFWRIAVDGCRGGEVAEELDMKVGAVYTAKSRVLKRLHEEFKALGFDSSNGDV